MKNTKELQPILTALYVLNHTSECKDETIELILDYAFRTFFGANTNLLCLACVGQKYPDMHFQVRELLEQDTNFKKYMEEYRK